MKTALFFDIDGTLFDNDAQKVSAKMIETIKKLSKDDRYLVGLATGRSMEQLGAIEEIKDLFKIKILINGAVAYHENEFIYGQPLNEKDCADVLEFANDIDVSIGFVGRHEHAISGLSDYVTRSLSSYQMLIPKIDPLFYMNQDVFQIWIFSDDKTIIEQFREKFSMLKLFPWHQDGADLVHPNVSKGKAINYIKKHFLIDRVIAFGDGENDVEMIEVADIGVAMANSQSKELKNKATFITDHISEDGLYNALVKLNLI